MNITVKVDEISLSTAVDAIVAQDENGDFYPTGEARTLAHLVAEMMVDRLVRNDNWPSLGERVRDIRAEVIREAVRPQIEEAIAAPVCKTNAYGEPVGEPTTLRSLIVTEARKALNEPVDRYSRDKGTFLTKTVREEVASALKAEIADAVKQAREQVANEIGQQVANAVTAAMKAR